MRRTLTIVAGLGLGVILSQFPEYAQQYTQRLGGAVDELGAIVTDFDRAATVAGLDRPQALARYAQTGDQFIVGRGSEMGETIARYEHLSLLLGQVQTAGPLERALYFPEFFDPQIASRALDNFRPAVPVTLEGLAYTAVGFVLGGGAMWFFVGWLRALFGPRRARVTYRDDLGYD
jgi:hypothetical protein